MDYRGRDRDRDRDRELGSLSPFRKQYTENNIKKPRHVSVEA